MVRRAAIYIRVSDRAQVGGDSLDAQRATLSTYAEQNGYVIVAEYEEAGESARVSDRPAFQAMAADAQHGRFDTILLWKWDRFARNRDDAVIYKLLFAQDGVDLMAVGEPQLEGSEGRLLEGIMDAVAEFQSATTAAHVKNTMLHNARQGRWQGNTPFGYRIDEETGRLRIEEPEAVAVRWAFQKIMHRKYSLRGLAKEFREGRPFASTMRHKWSNTAIRGLLSNPAYIGVMRWNTRRNAIKRSLGMHGITTKKVLKPRDEDEWIIVENAHAAIIDPDVFDLVQQILTHKRIKYSPRSRVGEYLFRGLCRCIQCGGNMIYNRKGQGPIRLICSKYFTLTPCRPSNFIRLEELTQAVIQEAKEVIGATTIENITVVMTDETATELVEPDWKERESRLVQMHVNSLIDLETFMSHRKQIEEDRKQWLANYADRNKKVADSLPELQERVSNVATLLQDEKASVENKNLALLAVINDIVVDRQAARLEIVWRMPAGL